MVRAVTFSTAAVGVLAVSILTSPGTAAHPLDVYDLDDMGEDLLSTHLSGGSKATPVLGGSGDLLTSLWGDNALETEILNAEDDAADGEIGTDDGDAQGDEEEDQDQDGDEDEAEDGDEDEAEDGDEDAEATGDDQGEDAATEAYLSAGAGDLEADENEENLKVKVVADAKAGHGNGAQQKRQSTSGTGGMYSAMKAQTLQATMGGGGVGMLSGFGSFSNSPTASRAALLDSYLKPTKCDDEFDAMCQTESLMEGMNEVMKPPALANTGMQGPIQAQVLAKIVRMARQQHA